MRLYTSGQSRKEYNQDGISYSEVAGDEQLKWEKLLKGQTYHREKKAIRQLLLAKGQTGVSRNCVRTGFTGLIRLKLCALKHTPGDMEL